MKEKRISLRHFVHDPFFRARRPFTSLLAVPAFLADTSLKTLTLSPAFILIDEILKNEMKSVHTCITFPMQIMCFRYPF